MPRVARSVLIARPVDEVFAFFADRRTDSADLRMTELVPGRRVAFVGVAGPVQPDEVSYDFEAVDGGTRVTYSFSVRLSGPMKLFLAPTVQKSIAADLAALDVAKRVLESGTLGS